MAFNPQNVNGQATMANSSPVVVASDQAAFPVTANAGTNLNTSALATSAKQDTLLTELQLKADLTETQPVSLASVPSHAVTVVDGGNAVEGTTTGAAVITDATGTIQQYLRGLIKLFITAGSALVTAVCRGGTAHGGGITDNPFRVALRTIAHGTNPTQIAAALTTDWYANRHGVPFVMGGHPNVQTFRANYTAAQTNAAIVTVAAGLKIVVTRLSVMAHNANTVNVAVVIGFATVTTPTGAGVVLAHPGIAAGSGVVEGNGGGILGVGADDEDLRITSGVPTTGSIDVVVSYYTIEG